MVDMVLVRQERVASVAYSGCKDAHHVKQWNGKCAQCHDAYVMEVNIPYGIGLPEMQDEERERVAQCQ